MNSIDYYAGVHQSDKASTARHCQISGISLPPIIHKCGGIALPLPMVHAMTYDRAIGHLRDQPINILELGILGGGSLRMWYDAFPLAQIYGWDCEIRGDYENERIHVAKFHQESKTETVELAKKIGVHYDVIVDDCSHFSGAQQLSLGVLFPWVKPGGYYFIEDVDVSPDTVKIAERFIREGVFYSPLLTESENLAIQQGSVCEFAGANNILFRKKP